MDGDQVDKELEINLRSGITSLMTLIYGVIVTLVILIMVQFEFYAIIVFGAWISLDIIFTLYLHIEYYIINKGERYLIRYDELVKIKNWERETYKVSDIDYIEVFMSPAVYRGSNFHFLGIEAYHYAEVHLRSGGKLYVTCLLTPKVEKALRQLRGVQIRRKKRVYNQIG